MTRSDTISLDPLQTTVSTPDALAGIERQAHEMRARAAADGVAGLVHAITRLFGSGSGNNAAKASL